MNMKRLTIGVLALLLSPSAFALRGKTFYHYTAYEAAFWNKSSPVTAAEYPLQFLDRTNVSLPLNKVPFDTLVFAPVLGFGEMAAILPSSGYPKAQPRSDSRWLANNKNAMPELVKQGIDPITETLKWCKKNQKEAIISLPINFQSVHSYRPTPNYPPASWRAFLWPEFKDKNLDCLVNTSGHETAPYGWGLAVNYEQSKVRDKFTAIATEIAGKYDFDALLIDFMDIPTLFTSVASGGTASAKEVEFITQMMIKIKEAVTAASARVGHKIEFGARVPDSVGYCKDIGINLQQWFDTKLLDFVFLGGQFQLNPWDVTGGLAKKAGIPYYASFTVSGIYVGNDSGYWGDDERLPRQSRMCFNARIMDLVRCQASGIMYTMGKHHHHGIDHTQIVPFDAKAVRTADKRYFTCYTNDRLAGESLRDGVKHRTLQSLISQNPQDLAKGGYKGTIDVWDDFSALKKDGLEPKITLITEILIPSGMDTIVSFNGKELKPYKKRSGTQMYHLTPQMVKIGPNEVMVKSKGKNRRGATEKIGNVSVEVRFPKPGEKEGGK